MPLAPNSRLGRYEIRSLLGAGGMGEVYLAEDLQLRRKVAIKLLPAELSTNTDRLMRFEREAYAASSLNHPNILTIHEFGAEAGVNFIATEFIDGESLRQRMARPGTELREVLDIGIQVGSALGAAHAAGIVHRDIKPENIMLRRDGIAKVLDFGLAKLTDRQAPSSDRGAVTVPMGTEPGVMMGTVSYMSPEQARLQDLDGRTDIWSLGVVLYEMVAGRLPFEGATRSDVISLILHKEPLTLMRLASDVPSELERIITKALQKNREERYQLVSDLVLDLKSLKQRLEFEVQLERTGETERNGGARLVASSAPSSTARTSQVGAAQTDSASGILKTTSVANFGDQIKEHKRGVLLILATIIVATIGGAYFAYTRYFALPGETAIDSIVVLPFVNNSGDPDMEYLSDGLSESLINALSQLRQLRVIARSSAFKYKGKEIDPEEVAKALGVRAIVSGRVMQRGNTLQVSVEMVDVPEKRQVWGEHYTREVKDIQAVQEEIAHSISEKLRVRITGTEEQQLVKRATENPQAYQLYLNGVFYRRKGGIENGRKSLDYLNQAVALDPNFALAWAELAGTYRFFAANGVLEPKEALAKATAAAQKALELDEKLADAHTALGVIKFDEWDWAGAEREFRRAVELNPNLAETHFRYGIYLSFMGRHTEALAEVKRAQELDPLRIAIRGQAGAALYFARRYDEALQQLQNTIKMESDYSSSRAYLGYTYTAKGMYELAIEEYRKYISIDGETTSIQCYLGYALAQSGKRSEALHILEGLKATQKYVSPAELAILYIGLGDKEGALASLEKAYTAHDLQMVFLKTDQHYDSLRADHRFQNLLSRVGLAS